MVGVLGRHGCEGGDCCFGVVMASFDGIIGGGLWGSGGIFRVGLDHLILKVCNSSATSVS